MITIYNNSFKVSSTLKKLRGNSRPSRRGRVVGFSSASSRRLKDKILSLNCDFLLGFTLTFPAFDSDDFDFSEFFRQFKQGLKRRSSVGFIWRLEKQQNGRPHYHCLTPFPSDYIRFLFILKSTWKHYLRFFKIPYSWDEYFLDFQIVTSSTALNYLVLHASKHKVQQIVSEGRSWGVVNSHVLDFRKYSFNLPRYYQNLISRTYKRYLKKLDKKSFDSYFVIKYSDLFKRICHGYLKKYFPENFNFSDLFLKSQEKKV